MQKIILLITSLAFTFSVPAIAQQPTQTITLKDGTAIKGHLSSVANGSYTIENETMGQVKIPAEQIVSINAAAANPAASTITNSDGKLSPESFNSVKTNIMQDPQIMDLIQDLLKDPAIAEMLKNPSLLQDALSMDPQRIGNNPDVQKLMQNPTMQEILKVTAQKMQDSSTK